MVKMVNLTCPLPQLRIKLIGEWLVREDTYFSKHTNLQTKSSVEHQVNSDYGYVKVGREIGNNLVQLPDFTNKKKNHVKEKHITKLRGKTGIRFYSECRALLKCQHTLSQCNR